MFFRFLKTAWRNIVKHQVFSLINFTGLSIGIALTLLIFIYVREEVSYDKFQTKIDRVYRFKYSLPAQDMELATSPPPVAEKMQDHFSEIEKIARVFGRNASVRRIDDVFEEEDVYFVDTTLLDIIDFDFVKGSQESALVENTVVLNESTAQKYFGTENPIG